MHAESLLHSLSLFLIINHLESSFSLTSQTHVLSFSPISLSLFFIPHKNAVHQWRFLRPSLLVLLRLLFTSATFIPNSPTLSFVKRSHISIVSFPFAFAETLPPETHSVMAMSTSSLLKTVITFFSSSFSLGFRIMHMLSFLEFFL